MANIFLKDILSQDTSTSDYRSQLTNFLLFLGWNEVTEKFMNKPVLVHPRDKTLLWKETTGFWDDSRKLTILNVNTNLSSYYIDDETTRLCYIAPRMSSKVCYKITAIDLK